MSEPSIIAPWIAAGGAVLAAVLTLIFGFLVCCLHNRYSECAAADISDWGARIILL